MEFLTLLGLIHVLVVMAFIFWPKREAPDLDWKSCVMRREEEESRKREKAIEKAEEDDDWLDDDWLDKFVTNPFYEDVSAVNIWNSVFDD